MNIDIVIAKANLLRQIRDFFYCRNVLEVDTPHLANFTTQDPQIASFKCDERYLQTSPEFFMKRLLCQNSGDIYQLAHVFRDEQNGSLHAPEFMLLEWYRLGFSLDDLIHEVFDLVRLFLPNLKFKTISYQKLFQKHLAVADVHQATTEQLKQIYLAYKPPIIAKQMDRDAWLNILMADMIEPKLSGAVFVHSYPNSQASLAKIKHGLAQRFELYINGVEIANGFDELQNSKQQHSRFIAENEKRKSLALPEIPIDEEFLQALNMGLPQCCGVALGVDRLLMLIMGLKNIKSVIPF